MNINPALKSPIGYSNKAKWFKIFVLFLILAFAVSASYYTTKNRLKLFGPKNDMSKLLEDDSGKPTSAFYEEAKTKTYEELKEKAPSVVKAPNVTNASIATILEHDREDVSSENSFVIFDENGLSANASVIKQGDVVTWKNESDKKIEIKAKDWGTFIAIGPDEAFTQQFDFIGSYEYAVRENGEELAKGRVEVKAAQ